MSTHPNWPAIVLTCAVISCAFCGPTRAEEIKAELEQGSELTVGEIIARMLRVYETCQSYQDEGQVEIQFPKHTDILPFSTAFVRPDRFRYECTQQSPTENGPLRRMVVWWDSKLIQSWWTVDKKLREFNELHSALVGPSAVLMGAAYRIPSMLVSPPFQPRWSEFYFRNAKLLGQEMVDDVLCYRFDTSQPGIAVSETVWIDQERFLILKILEVRTGEPKTTTITTYHPQINIDIDPETFTFVPPVVDAKVAATSPPPLPPPPWYMRLARKLFGP